MAIEVKTCISSKAVVTLRSWDQLKWSEKKLAFKQRPEDMLNNSMAEFEEVALANDWHFEENGIMHNCI